ncbi:DUF3667 domain-containing protein [Rubricoccus marinus]|uniref:DUF3667 domain-containing protein n=1 Tax=Rubricoccus marinus TaxID=716817 RepID=A0A259U043_9BACT|nr:DUF3667 domain-containing protein [Rubricoccus marinus]OZC03320.1 hypothetical protein BSZ36_10210 [Rubricoccus marinus]
MPEVAPPTVPLLASEASPAAPPEASGDGVALCANCDAVQVGAYCPGCGQHQSNSRLTLRRLWTEFASRAFNVNRGLLATVVELTKHPGQVPLDYVEGKRQRYTNPLTYLFLASAVSLFMLQFSDATLREQMQEQIARQEASRAATAPPSVAEETTTGVPHDHDGDGIADHADDPRVDLFRAELDVLMADGGATYVERVMEMMRRYQSFLMLLLCVPFALLLRLLFGPKRNLAEISVFSLYVVGHAILLLAFITPLLIRMGTLATMLGTLAYVGFAAWAAVRFWGEGWSAALRAGTAMTVGMAAYSAFIGLVSIVAVFGSALSKADASWWWLVSRIARNVLS